MNIYAALATLAVLGFWSVSGLLRGRVVALETEIAALKKKLSNKDKAGLKGSRGYRQ